MSDYAEYKLKKSAMNIYQYFIADYGEDSDDTQEWTSEWDFDVVHYAIDDIAQHIYTNRDGWENMANDTIVISIFPDGEPNLVKNFSVETQFVKHFSVREQT